MTGRPELTEAAPNYFKYIDQVPGDDAIAALEHELETSAALFAGISAESSLKRYAPEKWTIRQVLNHVTDTERAFCYRAMWFARGFDAPLAGYDQAIATAGAGANSIAWAAHVEEFRAVRLATIALFRNMPAEAWLRTGTASEKQFTVRAMAFIAAGHSAHHFAIVRDRYL